MPSLTINTTTETIKFIGIMSDSASCLGLSLNDLVENRKAGSLQDAAQRLQAVSTDIQVIKFHDLTLGVFLKPEAAVRSNQVSNTNFKKVEASEVQAEFEKLFIGKICDLFVASSQPGGVSTKEICQIIFPFEVTFL